MKDFDSIVDHMWVRNFDYGRIEVGRRGPLVPEGGEGVGEMIEFLKVCEKGDARFEPLADLVTQNFDKFEEEEEEEGAGAETGGGERGVWEGAAAAAGAAGGTGEGDFVGYTFKRKKKPRLPLTASLFDQLCI